jgi:hypothetical protein
MRFVSLGRRGGNRAASVQVEYTLLLCKAVCIVALKIPALGAKATPLFATLSLLAPRACCGGCCCCCCRPRRRASPGGPAELRRRGAREEPSPVRNDR